MESKGKEEMVVRILLVDDSEHVRRALRNVLESSHEDWVVCGEARNGREAVVKVEGTTPDIILLDFSMPDMNGLEVAREIRYLTPVPILLVTLYLSEQLSSEAKKAGIRGACPKQQARSVMHGIETLLRNDTYFPLERRAA
jgi:DNA-binding NarL/FixJ family response regulator